MQEIPVVIDTDPGNDDALAILVTAAAPGFRICGLSTVAGNVPAEVTARNALAIADAFGIDAPVTAGAHPLLHEYEPLDVSIMGVGGLGRTSLPEPGRELDPRTSVELLYDVACREAGALHVLALGPLTNLALLLREHPDAREKIAHITVMGGSLGAGNVTPRAEFNVHTDAEAARVVFGAGIPLTMVGIEPCRATRVRSEDFERICAGGGRAARFVGDLFFWPGDEGRPFPERGVPIYDALAAASLVDPACVRCERYHVDVECKGELTYGETVVDVDGRLGLAPNAEVALEPDCERFLSLLERTVRHFEW